MKGNAHDRFFKEMLANRDRALDFLKFVLPDRLSTELDYSTVRQVKDSFVDEKLQEIFSDVLFSCAGRGGGGTYTLSILIEHKSYKDTNVVFQLLRYLASGYYRQAKSQENVGIIIPIVFYQGDKGWDFKQFREVFSDAPGHLQRYLPGYEAIFVDLYRMPVAMIKSIENDALRAALYAQKYGGKPDELVKQIVTIFNQFRMLPDGNFIKLLLVYIVEITAIKNEQMIEITDQLKEPVQKRVKSTYENIVDFGIEKGMKKGMEIGMEKGKVELVRNVATRKLAEGSSLEEIAAFFAIEVDELRTILESD